MMKTLTNDLTDVNEHDSGDTSQPPVDKYGTTGKHFASLETKMHTCTYNSQLESPASPSFHHQTCLSF